MSRISFKHRQWNHQCESVCVWRHTHTHSTLTHTLTLKSMPTVEMKLPARKAPSLKRTSRQVFPTPESPTSITWDTHTHTERSIIKLNKCATQSSGLHTRGDVWGVHQDKMTDKLWLSERYGLKILRGTWDWIPEEHFRTFQEFKWVWWSQKGQTLFCCFFRAGASNVQLRGHFQVEIKKMFLATKRWR